MKLLLDENVPAPITSTVKTLLRRSHDVQHVIDLPGWSGTKDLHLYGKAFSARRGTYRIIYRINDKNRVVTVVDVDHRRDVYRT